MSTTSLQALALRNDVVALRRALDSGVDVDSRDELGSTALHCAIAWKACDAVDVLLDFGADVLQQDRDGKTALHYAIEYRLPDVAAAVLGHDRRVISVSDVHGNQPLWTAAFNARGDYQLVTLLLDYGADPDHRNRVGRTPKDIARRKGESDLLELLEGTKTDRS